MNAIEAQKPAPATPRCPTCRDEGLVVYEVTFDDLSGLATFLPYPASTSSQGMSPRHSCPDCNGGPRP